MGSFPSLVRLYFRSVYGLKPLSDYRTGKDKAKLAGLALLILLLLGDLGLIFASSAVAQYKALKPQGLEGLLLLNAAVMSSMIVFVFGFVMALSTYSLSAAEQGLLALPIRPRAFLAAKFIVVYLSEVLFSLFLIGINLVVFGIHESPPLPFYLCGLLVSLAMPLIPLALAYLLIVPLISLARFMRSKNAVLFFGGIVGVAFGIAFNVYIQGSMARLADPEWILRSYAGPGSVLNLVGSAWPPSWLAWESLSAAREGAWGAGIAWSLVLIAAGLAVSALVVLSLARSYGRSLLDFGEGVLKKLGSSEAKTFIRAGFARRPAFLSLLLRENRMMNREPMYFLNGPFVVILMPAILGVMYLVQKGNLAALLPFLEGLKAGPGALLVAAAFGGFLGSSTSITCSALSRDAKALPYLLALPIPPTSFMLAKLAHGLLYAVFGSVVGTLGAGLILGLDALTTGGALLVALAFSLLANTAGLWLDTANPRLSWDNPVAALKQNPNTTIAILGTMGLIGGLGAVSGLLPLGPLGFVLAYGGGSALASAILLSLYPRFAAGRLAMLET